MEELPKHLKTLPLYHSFLFTFCSFSCFSFFSSFGLRGTLHSAHSFNYHCRGPVVRPKKMAGEIAVQHGELLLCVLKLLFKIQKGENYTTPAER